MIIALRSYVTEDVAEGKQLNKTKVEMTNNNKNPTYLLLLLISIEPMKNILKAMLFFFLSQEKKDEIFKMGIEAEKGSLDFFNLSREEM